jgi:hypothetical protein
MKKVILSVSFMSCFLVGWGQTQIGNGNFEAWETAASGQEPTNWNSFLTAGGSLSWAASDQCASSTQTRPGSTGTKSAYIFSNSALGIIANGNLTLGKINMGSATPSGASNYNSSVTADPQFSETLTVIPDSLVFWMKFTPASGNTTDSSRVSAMIHDVYDFRDPIDANSASHLVATAIRNFGKTNGNWMRVSIPFTAIGPSTNPAYILLTYTTNKTPGGGSDNDELWIDDVELIYNGSSAGITENNSLVFASLQGEDLVIVHPTESEGTVRILNTAGQLVANGNLNDHFSLPIQGIYFVQFETEQGTFVQQVIR